MAVHVTSEHPRGAAAVRLLARRARAFLSALGMPRAELTVIVTTDRRIRRVNRLWRRIDRATDVLSFPAAPHPQPISARAGARPPPPRWLGDVVVSLDTAQRRAREEARPVGEELSRYLAHGLLHLLGHDHERPADAKRMAKQEAALLTRGEGLVGAALGRKRVWTSSRTSTSTRKPSGSTAPGTRARTSRARSRS